MPRGPGSGSGARGLGQGWGRQTSASAGTGPWLCALYRGQSSVLLCSELTSRAGHSLLATWPAVRPRGARGEWQQGILSRPHVTRVGSVLHPGALTMHRTNASHQHDL